MRRTVLSLLALLAALPLLTGCKGRTAGPVDSDGSPPVEVSVMETESASTARDSLRARVADLPADTVSAQP